MRLNATIVALLASSGACAQPLMADYGVIKPENQRLIFSQNKIPVLLPQAAKLTKRALSVDIGVDEDTLTADFCLGKKCDGEKPFGVLTIRKERFRPGDLAYECKNYVVVQKTLACFTLDPSGEGSDFYFIKYGYVYDFMGFTNSLAEAKAIVAKMVSDGPLNRRSLLKEALK